MFIADFYAFGIWGKPITEANYVHRQFGPVPNEIPAVQEKMKSDGRIDIGERDYFGYKQKRVIPLANPDLSLFTTQEIQLVHQVLVECRSLNSTQLSEWTHKLRPWLDTENGETIPYHTVFVLREVPVTYDDVVWGLSKIKQLQGAESHV